MIEARQPRRGPPRAPRALPKALSCLLALALLGGDLGLLVHLSRVAHVVCPDHGALLEVGGEGLSSRQTGLSGAPRDEAARGHVHCTSGGSSPIASPSGVVGRAVSGRLALGTVRAAPPLGILPPSRRFTLAPKQSPPA